MEAPTLDLKIPDEEKGDEVNTADGGELQPSDISVERSESTSGTVGNDTEVRTETESACGIQGVHNFDARGHGGCSDCV